MALGVEKKQSILRTYQLTKKPVLLIGNGCCSQKIASFDSEEAAEGFCKMLGKWLMVESEE